jgi:hypothetical protein
MHTLVCPLRLVVFCGLALHIGVAQAQAPAAAAPATQAQNAEALNALYGDFAAPDLTAPTLLGVNASQVSKPANVKAFATNIIGAVAGFPDKGKGLGIEIAPAQFFQRAAWKQGADKKTFSLHESLKAYANPLNRIGRGLTLSGAQVSTDSTARIAAGGAVVLLDRTDPLLDVAYIEDLATALAGQKEAQEFRELAQSHNSRIATQRQQLFAAAAIYDNEWDDARRIAARPLNDKLDRLMDQVGLLPPDIADTPEAFGADQEKKLAALTGSLDALQAAGELTKPQKQQLALEAQRLTEGIQSSYQLYYDLRQKVTASTSALVKTARENFDKKLWNASIVQLGGGWTWSSPDNTFSTLKAQAGSGFLRAALRPARDTWANQRNKSLAHFLYWHSQLVVNIQYQDYRSSTAKLPAKARTAADSLSHRLWYGARLLVGGAYFRLSLEGSVQHLSYNQPAQDAATKIARTLPSQLYTATIGAEVRLIDKIWLEFAIGTAKPSNRNSQLLALSSLKYAIRNSQRFKTN